MTTPDIPSDLIIETTSQGFWMIDSDTFKTIKVNNALCEMLGYTRQDFEGKTPGDFVTEESRQILHSQYDRIPTEQQRRYELVFIRKDGTEMYARMNATTVWGDDGQHQAAFAFITDITKEHLAEQALHEREELYRQMFINNTAVKLLIDPSDGAIQDANPAALDFYGYSLDEIRQLAISDINTASKKHLQEEMQRAKDEQRMYFLFKHRLKSGEVRDVEVYTGPVTLHGKPLLHSIIHDITDRVRYQNTLEAQAREIILQKERAEQADHAKSDFLAQMSHELRTPLNSIIGFSDIMRLTMLGPISDKYREYAEMIHGSGEHLLRIISDLLDLSKIEAGHVDLHLGSVTPQALIMEAITMTRPMASDHGIEISSSLANDLPVIQADEQRLLQVMLNLLSNAIKFTPNDGHIQVLANCGNDSIDIHVTDNGIGMSRDEIRIALSPFGQVDGNPLKRRFEGTGLGLTLVQQLVEMHRGHLTIDSTPKVGTTVTVTLPLIQLD